MHQQICESYYLICRLWGSTVSSLYLTLCGHKLCPPEGDGLGCTCFSSPPQYFWIVTLTAQKIWHDFQKNCPINFLLVTLIAKNHWDVLAMQKPFRGRWWDFQAEKTFSSVDTRCWPHSSLSCELCLSKLIYVSDMLVALKVSQ